MSIDQANVALVFVDGLCVDSGAIDAALVDRDPAAVVVVSCETTSAVASVRGAIRLGTDSARCAGVSLSIGSSPMMILSPELMEIICAAAARRCQVLAFEPAAGTQRMQLRGPLSRRELLQSWRPSPRRAAGVSLSRCLGAKRCGICVAACPTGAIRVIGDEVVVDPLKCNFCNACAYNCPAAAISVPGASLDALAAQLQVLLNHGLRDVSFACESHPAPDSAELAHTISTRSVIVGVPCVASLGPGLMLGLASKHCVVRTLASPDCDRARELERTERFVLRVLESAGRGDLSRYVLLTRRVVTDAPGEPNGIVGEPQCGGYDKPPLVANEPNATSKAVRELLEGWALPEVVQGQAFADDAALGGVVRIDPNSCTRCGACALVCPTEAITKGPTGNLVVDVSVCVACDRCMTVCPERSVTTARGLDLLGVLAGPTALPGWSDSDGVIHSLARDDAGPMLTSVLARLATGGANGSLLHAIREQASRTI